MACQALHSLLSKGSGGHRSRNPNVRPFSHFLKVLRVSAGTSISIIANFYEKEGFRRALEDDLTNTREDRLFLYVAAHGTGKRIGGLKARTGMKLPAMFKAVKDAANYSNIEGVLIGSCSVGNNIDDFISTTKNSSHCVDLRVYLRDRVDGEHPHRCLDLRAPDETQRRLISRTGRRSSKHL